MKKLLVVAVSFSVVGFAAGAMWNGGLTVEAEGDGHGAAVPISGDVNADGRLDVSDGIYIINYVFRGGPLPVAIECPTSAVPATGQTKCYDEDGTEISCTSADFPGQDAFYQAGCGGEGRFVDNLDGTVTDHCTGLMWQKDTAPGTYTWQNALRYCEDLPLGDHSDWRLPNVRELQSIVDYGHVNPSIDPIFGAVSFDYWSSSTFVHSSDAWLVYFAYGFVGDGYEGYDCYVRAVRGGL